MSKRALVSLHVCGGSKRGTPVLPSGLVGHDALRASGRLRPSAIFSLAFLLYPTVAGENALRLATAGPSTSPVCR